MQLAEPRQWSIHHHINTSTYYNGQICLLGDSAHATSPHQASGAGQCLEDALLMSNLLGLVASRLNDDLIPSLPSDLITAFKVFDEIRRPRAQKVVATSM